MPRSRSGFKKLKRTQRTVRTRAGDPDWLCSVAKELNMVGRNPRTMTNDELEREVRRPRLSRDERAAVKKEIVRRAMHIFDKKPSERETSMGDEALLRVYFDLRKAARARPLVRAPNPEPRVPGRP